MNLYKFPIGSDYPKVVNCVVEIPKGTRAKYEYDPELEVFMLDRFLTTSMSYPINYGFIPQTLSDDGDALDALIYSPDPIITGAVVECQPICTLDVIDSGESDHKVLMVPTFSIGKMQDVDAMVDDITKNVIKNFFENYKKLEHNKNVIVKGWCEKSITIDIIKSAHEMFKSQNILKH